jgi:probable rRNA maturation factor
MEETFSITNTTKGKLPRLPFVLIKEDILGPSYDLSVAFVSPAQSHALNLKHRGKDKPTNVLSFTLSKKSGELILCPAIIKKEVGIFEMSYPELLQFLVIHGMLHLKGLEHSSRMERAELRYTKKYSKNINDKKNFNRHRPGNIDHKSGGRRIRKGRKKS